jgi:predicted phage-related endonuclease
MNVERIPIQSRDQWLALRAHDITASDVPAVCGEGVYGSAAKVWAEKRGLLTPQEMNEAMKRGLWGEAAVFEALTWERPEWELRRAKVYLRDASARLGATPDGAAIDPARAGVGVIQAKVVSKNVFVDHWLENPDDDPHDMYAPARPPLGYQLQTLTESMLADADWAMVAALIVDQWRWTLRLFPVDRHTGAEEMIRGRVAAFWADYLDPGIQPPIDPERDDELVKRLYPRDDGTTIDLSADNLAPVLVRDLAVAKKTIKDATERERAIKTELQAKLGQHTYGRLGDGQTISWKLQQRSGYSVEPSEFRVMRILKGRVA